jgi:hypothetical protein
VKGKRMSEHDLQVRDGYREALVSPHSQGMKTKAEVANS